MLTTALTPPWSPWLWVFWSQQVPAHLQWLNWSSCECRCRNWIDQVYRYLQAFLHKQVWWLIIKWLLSSDLVSSIVAYYQVIYYQVSIIMWLIIQWLNIKGLIVKYCDLWSSDLLTSIVIYDQVTYYQMIDQVMYQI